MKTQKTNNIGRVDWKLEFPKSVDEIRNSSDDDLVRWYRFLPEGNTPYKNYMNNEVRKELYRRYNPPKQFAIT